MTDLGDHMIVPSYKSMQSGGFKFTPLEKRDRPFSKNTHKMQQNVKEALFSQKMGQFTTNMRRPRPVSHNTTAKTSSKKPIQKAEPFNRILSAQEFDGVIKNLNELPEKPQKTRFRERSTDAKSDFKNRIQIKKSPERNAQFKITRKSLHSS
jgi:hypothetical protein